MTENECLCRALRGHGYALPLFTSPVMIVLPLMLPPVATLRSPLVMTLMRVCWND
jgi:hypothetical protein